MVSIYSGSMIHSGVHRSSEGVLLWELSGVCEEAAGEETLPSEAEGAAAASSSW